MQTRELAEINASIQAMVRRAYELGRSDALQKVVGVLNEDRDAAEPLALMAPNGLAEPPQHQPEPAIRSAAPWWAWRVR